MLFSQLDDSIRKHRPLNQQDLRRSGFCRYAASASETPGKADSVHLEPTVTLRRDAKKDESTQPAVPSALIECISVRQPLQRLPADTDGATAVCVSTWLGSSSVRNVKKCRGTAPVWCVSVFGSVEMSNCHSEKWLLFLSFFVRQLRAEFGLYFRIQDTSNQERVNHVRRNEETKTFGEPRETPLVRHAPCSTICATLRTKRIGL